MPELPEVESIRRVLKNSLINQRLQKYKIFEEEGKKVYDPKDQTKKELTDFIEQLSTKQFKDVQKFFETMPKLKHIVKVTNPNTGVESEIALEGMQSFLG